MVRRGVVVRRHRKWKAQGPGAGSRVHRLGSGEQEEQLRLGQWEAGKENCRKLFCPSGTSTTSQRSGPLNSVPIKAFEVSKSPGSGS